MCTPLFVVAPYNSDAGGLLLPSIPNDCPLRSRGDRACVVKRKDLRDRTTGPEFPLVVAKCRTHQRHFTIYPPGYAPYQRVSALRLAPDGNLLLEEDGKALKGLKAYEDTLFEAALDARAGRAWARDSYGTTPPERWWSTQRRHIEFALRLTGISGEIDDLTREKLALVLGVPLLLIREQARKELRGYRQRGTAVCKVLSRIRGGRRRAHRILLAGHLIGWWGRPWIWNPKRSLLEDLPFPGTSPPI